MHFHGPSPLAHHNIVFGVVLHIYIYMYICSAKILAYGHDIGLEDVSKGVVDCCGSGLLISPTGLFFGVLTGFLLRLPLVALFFEGCFQ